jgi:hypothetical protein
MGLQLNYYPTNLNRYFQERLPIAIPNLLLFRIASFGLMQLFEARRVLVGNQIPL